MIALLLSILSSIAILVIFRMFGVYGVNRRRGILVNYFIAALFGFLVFQDSFEGFDQPWMIFAAALGVLFYTVFQIMARVTHDNGVSTASIATKMSVVIPILIGLGLLSESMNALKGLGIVFGLGSIFLSSNEHRASNTWFWPLLLFIGSGAIDASIKLMQHFYVSDEGFPVFTTVVFACAFLSAFIHHLFLGAHQIPAKDFGWGTLLGLVNFAALYFLLRALAEPGWESSSVFPINNFGIIAGSTAVGVLAFRERIGRSGWLSLICALIAIILLFAAQ